MLISTHSDTIDIGSPTPKLASDRHNYRSELKAHTGQVDECGFAIHLEHISPSEEYVDAYSPVEHAADKRNGIGHIVIQVQDVDKDESLKNARADNGQKAHNRLSDVVHAQQRIKLTSTKSSPSQVLVIR